MKRLKVPTINVLDVLDITSIGSLLEEKAQREYISHANWREYPYKPITVFDIVRSKQNLLHTIYRARLLLESVL